MTKFLSRGGPALALSAALALAVAGCGKKDDTGGKDQPVVKRDGYGDRDGPNKGGDKKDPGKVRDGGDHSGWWCDEHALPEEVCDLCSRKYREAEKAKGNWCEHNRVKTSCFKCNPGVREKYAAEY
ncbi:MAG: hypothetical protein C0501_31700, partial [Isosphaera sp.]|nr:hypothetical protein [Isosphaera sp.]